MSGPTIQPNERAALVARLTLQNVYTPTQAAVLLGKSRSWVEQRCKEGKLPARRIGSRYVLTKADLQRDGWLGASPADASGVA